MFIYVSVGVCYIENIVSFRRGGDHEHHHQCGDYCSCGHASVSGYAFAVSSFCVILVLPMVLSHKDMTLVSKLCADAVVAIAGALWIWRTTFRKDLMLAFLLFLLIGNVAGFLRWKWSKTAKQE